MTDQPHETPEKKIYIDEDWKSKVEAERQEAQKRHAEDMSRAPQAASQPEASPDAPFPPPSLAILATTLGMQAMSAMGLIPDPVSGKTEAHLNQARHLIDMVQMLQDKTAGNRTDEETAVLDGLLHELRMGYVAVAQQPK